MKRIVAIVLCMILVVAFAACGKKPTATPSPAPTVEPTAEPDAISSTPLADIMTAIISDSGTEFATMEIEVDAERYEWFLFTAPVEGVEAYASEAMIGSIPHSVVLARVPESMDAAAFASDLESKVDLRKWICVEAEKSITAHRGNVVLLVMSTTAVADKIAENFEAYGK